MVMMKRFPNRSIQRAVTLVAPRFVEQFFARPRKDYRQWKRITNEQLEDVREGLPCEIEAWDRLHRDQKICALIGARQPAFAFWNDPGTGKTMLSLTLMRYHQLANGLRRVLVLVPNNSNLVEWKREIEKHYPQMKYAILNGSSEEKWATLRENRDALVTVATYPGLVHMASIKVQRPNKRKMEMEPDLGRVTELMSTFQGLILDESSCVKTHDTIIFRLCRKLAQNAQLVLCLSGTPFGRDPQDLWTQMFLVDGGFTLGETLSLFRGAFFKTSVNRWGGYEHDFIKAKESLLHDVLANRSIRFAAREADLPKVNMIPQLIELSEEARDWYRRATQELRTAAGTGRPMLLKNTFLRMRQLSSGFVGLPADEDGVRARIEFQENPKLEQLISIVASIPLEYPVIIVHEFIYSGERIERELSQLNIPFGSLRGSTKDPQAVLQSFKDGQTTRLIINHKAGGFGLNLQNAGYMLFYESPVSAIIRRQVEARIVRQYSDWERVFIYDMMAAGTVDERIREFHHAADDFFQAILEGRAEL